MFRSRLSPEKIAHLDAFLAAHGIDPARRGPSERRDRSALLPLSYGQQQLWLLQHLTVDPNAYVDCYSIRFHGDLDVEALQASLTEIVRRHEILRTTLVESEPQPWQQVHEPSPADLQVIDLCDEPAATRQSRLEEIARAEAVRPMDLATGPLFRQTLVRREADQHVLFVSLHHAVFDGWSLQVLARELVSLYQALVGGRRPHLDELPIQYGDFAIWQRAQLTTSALKRPLEYWQRQLGSAPYTLDLPTDFPRPPVLSSSGSQLSFECSSGLSAALRNVAQQQETTLFITLLAAYGTLLSFLAQQETLLVGTPVAGRNHVETESLIGHFINPLVLTCQARPASGFREVLQQTHDAALGAYENQCVPFELLVATLKPERDASRNPLIQAWFNMEVAPSWPAFGGKRLEVDVVPGGFSRFDLALHITDGSQRLRGMWVFRTDLFRHSTIQTVSQLLVHVLETVVSEPNIPVGELHARLEVVKTRCERRLWTFARQHNASRLSSRRRRTVDVGAQGHAADAG